MRFSVRSVFIFRTSTHLFAHTRTNRSVALLGSLPLKYTGHLYVQYHGISMSDHYSTVAQLVPHGVTVTTRSLFQHTHPAYLFNFFSRFVFVYPTCTQQDPFQIQPLGCVGLALQFCNILSPKRSLSSLATMSCDYLSDSRNMGLDYIWFRSCGLRHLFINIENMIYYLI